jgi:MFS transporter, PPP family, 3-phenylpropionic acid transporter
MTPGFRVAQYMAAIFTVTAVNAFMPLWFADRGLTAAAIGQVLGFTSLFRVMTGPGWGTLADRIGTRGKVLFGSATTAMLLSLSFVPLHGFTPILLVAVTLGIVASAQGPLADSLALALNREGKLEYGPVRAAGSIAYMVVTAITGQLLALLGATLVPWLQALGYGLAAVFSRLLPEAASPPSAPRVLGGWQLFRLRPFRLTVAATALIQGSHAAYYGFAALAWRAQGIGDGMIGLLFAEAIIAEILLFLRGRRLVEWLGPAGLSACAASAGVLRWSAMAFAPPLPWLAGLQLLHAATFAMQHLAAMMVLSRTMPPERSATAQSLHSALGQGVPNGLMMLVTGFLFARFGAHAFLAMAMCSGLALILVEPLRRIGR